MVLELKILMYRNTDEIEKLKKIKVDSRKDQEDQNLVRIPRLDAVRA